MQLMSQSLNRSGLTRVSSRIRRTHVHHTPTPFKTIETLDSRFLILDRLPTAHDSMHLSQLRSAPVPALLLRSIKPARSDLVFVHHNIHHFNVEFKFLLHMHLRFDASDYHDDANENGNERARPHRSSLPLCSERRYDIYDQSNSDNAVS
jgi:hypothetical protein